jgi:nucleoid-associated protein YgaU
MADKGISQGSGGKKDQPAAKSQDDRVRDSHMPEEERGVGRASAPASSKTAAAKSTMDASREKHLPEEERGVGQPSASAKAKPVEAKPVEAAPVEAKPKTLAIHTVKSGDTLSHMALQYYGQATREKWMHIYEANKEQLGEYPGLIQPGDKLIIPELPDSK